MRGKNFVLTYRSIFYVFYNFFMLMVLPMISFRVAVVEVDGMDPGAIESVE